MRHTRTLLALPTVTATAALLAPLRTAPLAAQAAGRGPESASPAVTTPAALTAAAASIRAADLARHREALMADSLPGRATPSRTLEATARYVAEQFQRLGVQPRGDQIPHLDSTGTPIQVTVLGPDGRPFRTPGMDTSFLQRYPLLGNMTVADYSWIAFTVTLQKQGKPIVDAPPKTQELGFGGGDAFFAADSVPQSGGGGPWGSQITSEVIVVAGPHTTQTVGAASLQDKLVLYVPHAQVDTATRRQIIDRLRAANRVVILSSDDSATFAARRQARMARPLLLVDQYLEDALGAWSWAVEVRAQTLKEWLTVAGIDPAVARVATVLTVRPVPAVTATLHVQPGPPVASDSGYNVLGFLPGSDTTVRDQFVVYSAPLEDASGLLALANAFRQPGAAPRRSVLFATLSGAPDFAGATYFLMRSLRAADFTINLALGPLGRSASDSLTITGSRNFELASRPGWVALRHPELELVVADGGTIFGVDGLHVPFLRRAVPSLYLSSGDSGDVSPPGAVDLERAARALRLAFYLGQDLANAAGSTRWTSASRRARVRFLGR